MEIRISVRTLVEFILREGDIDNRIRTNAENAMQEGGRIHRMIQKQMGSEYHAEVSLCHTIHTDAYDLVIEGRADGIQDSDPVLIDEIKGTYRDLRHMKEPVAVHLAQAKCYAAIYTLQHDLQKVSVRMSYCNMDTEEMKYFNSEYTAEEITAWFDELVGQYRVWADFRCEWNEKRTDSVKNMQFPYAYRDGQKELAADCYRSICHEKKLFLEAPTGTGKTITTVFPAIKAIGEGKADRLFYLTAKTITRTVAEDTVRLLRTTQALKFKTVTLTARDKICFLEKSDCNPVSCSCAKGHYDRINKAMYDLLTHEDDFSREVILEYARRYQVCPFEMSLDMSLFSDGIICDYNYVFDPFVYLRRFFGDGVKGAYIFLIDEAHNLVDRGRDMYSAELVKEDFMALSRLVRPYHKSIASLLDQCNKELLKLKRECDGCEILDSVEPFITVVNRLSSKISEYLDEHSDGPVREEMLQFYFQVSRFLTIYDLVDQNYAVYDELRSDGSFMLKLLCVNPAADLAACMERGKASILFSATFLPIQYYKSLLGGTAEDYEVYARSIFDPARLGLFIGTDVTSRYTRRSELEYDHIAEYIHQITSARKGNYLVFFPSHQFLEQVGKIYEEKYMDPDRTELAVQETYMSEEDRESFLNRFTAGNHVDLSEVIHMEMEVVDNRSILGLCVMGGIFSEGIDLKNDSLIGVIVVGTGLPQVCNEREILKAYFDEAGQNGFDYAYRYPGMNKVLQAAGRVIRTETDTGIVALLDERFMQRGYQQLFPREWISYREISTDFVKNELNAFWMRWNE